MYEDHKVEFVLDIKPDSKLSLNKLYAGRHWAVRKKEADYFHSLVGFNLRNKHVKMMESPACIYIDYGSKCRLDIDNCSYMSKLIIDGLKGILIKDDSPKYVKILCQSFWDGEGIRVTVIG